MTAGVWSDLATITGEQSNPPWVPAGTDLDVRTTQFYLNRIAGARLREDGILGPKTAAALRAFQRHNGIYPSGWMDSETSGALEYLFFAISPRAKLKGAAAMSPASIARLEAPVTYTPYPMPGASYPAAGSVDYPSAAIPPDLLSALRYYQALAQSPTTYYGSGDRTGFRTGIQSVSMSDYRHHYDAPAYFEEEGWGGEIPYGAWY